MAVTTGLAVIAGPPHLGSGLPGTPARASLACRHRGLAPTGPVGRFGRAGGPKVLRRRHDARLPAQILWVNLLTHGLPGVALGGEHTQPLTGLDLAVVFLASTLGYAAVRLDRVVFRRKRPADPPGVASGGRP